MVPECLPSWLLETADQYPYFHYQYPYSIITTCISCGCRDPAPLGQYGGGFTLRLESPNMKVKPSVRPVSSLGCAFVIIARLWPSTRNGASCRRGALLAGIPC